jgi:iron complex transport system ATP-binding protein
MSGDHSNPDAGEGLQVLDLTVGYGKTMVLEKLSFRVPEGELTAIIGPNGCGKSTLLKGLSRTLSPRSGRVVLDGRDLGSYPAKHVAKRLALLPQDPIAPETIRVRELVARGRHPYHSLLRQWGPGDGEMIERAMERTHVSALADRFVSELSGGQRQRVWLAMVLAQDTDYVLLDEPTSFLDIAHQVELLHLCQDMKDDGRTVVAVLHDLNQAARYATWLVVMDAGRIVAEGRAEDVLTEDITRSVFSLDSEIVPDPQSGTPMVIPRMRPARL